MKKYELESAAQLEPIKTAYAEAGVPFQPALDKAYQQLELKNATLTAALDRVVAFLWDELMWATARPPSTRAGRILHFVLNMITFGLIARKK